MTNKKEKKILTQKKYCAHRIEKNSSYPWKAPNPESVIHLHDKDVIREFLSKDEAGPSICVGEELASLIPQEAEDLVAHIPFQDESGKVKLENKAPKHWTPVHLNTEMQSLAACCRFTHSYSIKAGQIECLNTFTLCIL